MFLTAPSGVYNELLERGTLENVFKWFRASGDTRRSLSSQGFTQKSCRSAPKFFPDHTAEGLESTVGALEDLCGDVTDDLLNLVIPTCPWMDVCRKQKPFKTRSSENTSRKKGLQHVLRSVRGATWCDSKHLANKYKIDYRLLWTVITTRLMLNMRSSHILSIISIIIKS